MYSECQIEPYCETQSDNQEHQKIYGIFLCSEKSQIEALEIQQQ